MFFYIILKMVIFLHFTLWPITTLKLFLCELWVQFQFFPYTASLCMVTLLLSVKYLHIQGYDSGLSSIALFSYPCVTIKITMDSKIILDISQLISP